ncbi:YegS/Rv2252/BmrU family lipid kinase [Arcicella aurantiaca]|uniref:YegS/Rv2252/BmrU family lipid kinase n=1 Tax=Arcicella aurantiaca TaxID=591202 RepID=A0A316EFJ8_9BACT|nr:YegS/Rv2252/BmrU family lipid kinase [Arcicella aurantiaca]PWK29370.1 YegS/Rv2252/BmrU family lipid kinase [Arcicella aurantiaca]
MNPMSGTTTLAQKNKIKQIVSKLPESQLFFTEYSGHATKIAQQAVREGIATVVAIGGDGTVNEVGKGLIGSNTSLGIIPIGSGNGLARHLKIPLKIEKAIQFVMSQPAVLMDVCFLNDIPFFCTAGVGFDAEVAHEFAKQNSRGLKTYARMALKSFRTYKSETFQIDNEDKTVFAITFANATQYGNNAMISPKSKIDDGLIEMVLLKPFPFGAAPIIGVRLFRGTLPNSRYIETQTSENFSLKAKKDFLIHYDGEPHQLSTNELSISIKKQSLKVVGNV